MSTFNRTVVAEAAVCGLLTTGAVALWSPGDLTLPTVGFHPAWIPILLIGARYGTRGLFTALGLVWGMLLVAGLALSRWYGGAPLQAFAALATSASSVLALSGAILVAWVALMHERRITRVMASLGDTLGWRKEAEKTMEALHETVGFLRARHDRIDVSLTLWRDLAARLERGDTAEAARAALELCAIRSGAAAGMVQCCEGAHRRTVAWRGQWTPTSPRPKDVFVDRTAAAAIARRRPTPASDVEGTSSEDSDVAIPVLDGAGAVSGVIALRGVAHGRLRAADLRDLVVIAQWLAPALARSVSPRQRTTASDPRQ